MGNAVRTLDTIDDIQAHNTTAKGRKEKTCVNTKASTFHDRSLFCSDCENLPACFLLLICTWYLVRGCTIKIAVLPLVSSTATTAHMN